MSLATISKFVFLPERSAWQVARPANTAGQVLRTFLTALVLMAIAGALILQASPSRSEPASDAARFQIFVQGLWPQAHARGVSRATFEAAFKDMTPDLTVLAATHKQAEFVKTVPQYLATAVSQKRIETGQDKAREWKAVLERIDQRYGVDPYIVLGVWGLESNFGTHTGDLSTIRSLATLAFAHYRGDYFRRELIAALEILQAGHVAPADMQGSWAGAMGQTQFMPSSFKTYAVDFDGDGRKDIWKNVPDALASTANYLHRHGWVADETWGYEVRLPASFAAASAGQPKSFPAWAAEGVRRADGEAMPSHGMASLLMPAGAEGPIFLVTRNFKVTKSYNNATSYALGVALLSDRIAGWGPLKADWPMAAR
jgi:lytic murein transglycosylase